MCDRNCSLKIRDEAFALCFDVLQEKLSDCYLYGSFARGDNNPYSDVDIMMVVNMTYEEINKIRSRISAIASDLSLKYDVTVSLKLQPKDIFYRFKDVVPFYRNVLKEGIRY